MSLALTVEAAVPFAVLQRAHGLVVGSFGGMIGFGLRQEQTLALQPLPQRHGLFRSLPLIRGVGADRRTPSQGPGVSGFTIGLDRGMRIEGTLRPWPAAEASNATKGSIERFGGIAVILVLPRLAH